MKEISVCIVDDVNELRLALEEIVSSFDGYKCIGTMSNASEALTRIPLLKPDVPDVWRKAGRRCFYFP